jgi:hypothetical protein
MRSGRTTSLPLTPIPALDADRGIAHRGSIHLATLQEFIREKPEWLTPDIGLVIFLPALLFEGSLKFQVRQLRENSPPGYKTMEFPLHRA